MKLIMVNSGWKYVEPIRLDQFGFIYDLGCYTRKRGWKPTVDVALLVG